MGRVSVSSHRRRPRYDRLATLGWLHFLNDGSANYLPGVLPAVLISLKLDVNLAGSMMTALVVGQALQPATGWLADRIGGRSLIIIGIAGTSLGGALVGLVPSPALLVALLFSMGCANALFHPQAMAGARSSGGDRQGLSMSLYLVGGEVGRGLWPVLASLVVVTLGLRQLWVLGLPALFFVPLLWRRLPVQMQRARNATPIDWRSHAGPALALVAFGFLRALAIFGASTFLPLLWHARGHDLVAGASTITVLLLVGIIGNIGGGHWGDRIGRRPILVGSGVLSALLLAGFLLTGGWLAWLLLGLLGISLFASLPLTVVIAQDLFPENPSFGAGLALGLCNGTAALALIGLSSISHHYGPEAPLWLLAVGLGVATVIALRMPCGKIAATPPSDRLP